METFSEETMNIVVGIVTALMGLSLPLFQQVIQQIDLKYDSILLVRRFYREKTYKYYNWALIVAFVLMLYIPFAPQCTDEVLSNYFVVSKSAYILALIAVVAEVILMFALSNLIRIYNDPQKLYERIVNHSVKGLDVNDDTHYWQFFDIMKYSIRKGNPELFISCKTTFYNCIEQCQENIGKNQLIYPDNIYRSVDQLIQVCRREEKLHPSQFWPEQFLYNLFTGYDDSIISDKTFSLIWKNLLQMAKERKGESLLNYWVYASQKALYTMKKRSVESDNSENEYSKEFRNFKEMHHVLCAYLLYRNEEKLLDDLLSYSPTFPPERVFMPKYITEAMRHLKHFSETFGTEYLETHYPFYSNKGASENDFIRMWVVRFYVLCLIKAKCSPTYYLDSDPFETPYPTDVSAVFADCGLYQEFYSAAEFFESEDTLYLCTKKEKEVLMDFKKVLENEINDAEQKVNHILEHQSLDKSKTDTAKEKTNKLFERFLETIPLEQKKDDFECNPLEHNGSLKVPKASYVDKGHIQFVNLENTIIHEIVEHIEYEFLRLFRLHTTATIFNVDYSEIKKALDALNLNNDYVALGCGIRGHDERIAYYFSSRISEIIIMKRIDMPSFVKDSFSKDIIEDFEDCNDSNGGKNEPNLSVKYRMTFTIQYLTRFRYIKLRIINSLLDDRKSQLQLIRGINQYIP